MPSNTLAYFFPFLGLGQYEWATIVLAVVVVIVVLVRKRMSPPAHSN